MDQDISLPIPAGFVDLIATLVAEKLAAESPSPWMTRAAAAEYLGVPVARLEKTGCMAPSHKWDGRVLYNRAELDAWLMELSS